MVQKGDGLSKAQFPVGGLVSNVPDIMKLLSNLISSASMLLKEEYLNLVFTPQLSSQARSFLRRDTENHAAPAGIYDGMPPVNHSLAALFVEDLLPLSHMPAGTITWNGMPNIIWAVNRQKGLAMIFATQLLPVDDETTV